MRDVFLVQEVPVILASLVAFSTLVAGPANERISLARRPADQDYVAVMAFAYLCKARVDFPGGILRAQFKPDRLMARALPFCGKQDRPVRFRDVAVDEAVIGVRRRPR